VADDEKRWLRTSLSNTAQSQQQENTGTLENGPWKSHGNKYTSLFWRRSRFWFRYRPFVNVRSSAPIALILHWTSTLVEFWTCVNNCQVGERRSLVSTKAG